MAYRPLLIRWGTCMDPNPVFLCGSKYVIDDDGLSICRRPSTVLWWSTMGKSDVPALRGLPPNICPGLFSVALAHFDR